MYGAKVLHSVQNDSVFAEVAIALGPKDSYGGLQRIPALRGPLHRSPSDSVTAVAKACAV
jgi:hypothetical protein